MKILVAVKRVVDAKVKVRPLPDHSGPDIKLARMAMNPFDEIAVEEAVELKEAGKASEVVAVSIGGAKSVDVLRTAMAIGADRAIHVVTDDAVEPLAAAKILAQIVEREKPGIVLLGKQAIDDDCGQTGSCAIRSAPLRAKSNSRTTGASSSRAKPTAARRPCRSRFLP